MRSLSFLYEQLCRTVYYFVVYDAEHLRNTQPPQDKPAHMNISFFSIDDTSDQTLIALREKLPEHTIYQWPDLGNPEDLDYAICWGAPDDFFKGAKNLRAIFSLAAGVDHLLNHAGLPDAVPVIRLSDAGMAEKIAEYVHFGVLRWHRQFDQYQAQQGQAQWLPLDDIDAKDYRVGIMGMGIIGSQIAARLQSVGYQVSGWKRTPSPEGRFNIYHGDNQLPEFLGNLNTLVCVLPLTPQTTGLINKTLLDCLPMGASFINVGRGGQVVEKDLIAALDAKHLSGALLDVCATEPLPENHHLWTHPDILLTPHIAGPTQINLSVDQIAAGIQQLQSGTDAKTLSHGVVDHRTGY